MTKNQHVNNETAARQENEPANDVEQVAAVPVVVPRVPQPIFTIVNPPLIDDISRESLLEWLRLRKEYVAVTEARCKAANEDLNSTLRTVRDSFNEDLLETMCETRWDVDIEDLTDEFLMEKITEITSSFKNKVLPDMDDLFGNELKMNESISDVEARVTAYFHLANEIIKRNGVTDLFAGEDGIKGKCKVLMKFLPGPLSKKVVNELEYRSGEAKASVRSLYKVVSNLALDLEKENRAVMLMKAKLPKSAKPFSTRGPMKVTTNKKTVTLTTVVPKAKQNLSAGHKQGEQRQVTGGPPPKQCFHCGGGHGFIECPTATEADKEAIRAKRRAEFKARKQASNQQGKRN
ncbi:hypothetical protein F442_19193 [Phytophthora nicotianae P10297]|uniref:CCHC-type domain-containing protein n=1 Tax=Phytophthora nicotianae P10297 TaxID=1317064 RepID=W2YAG7_PHYNI|nr:hypothetical protein F442_19193 [Phytophthora nicotianae P10297]